MSKIRWEQLAKAAWKVRENSFIYGKTKVGASVQTLNGSIFSGCNIEQTFRSHDVHAEVNAISTMIARGERQFCALLVVAERERFTPCGSCMDWIMQFGDDEAMVGFQNRPGGEIEKYKVHDLMPHYPK